MTMTVEAKIAGQNGNGQYMVNVRNANPKGMIGDAGVIRFFETKEEANEYANLVNTTGQDVFIKNQAKEEPVKPHYGDEFIKTEKEEKEEGKKEEKEIDD